MLDEINIREDILYNKASEHLVSVVNVDDVNNSLSNIEESLTGPAKAAAAVSVATHMLALYVRGLVTQLRFRCAHFSTTGISAIFLYKICWEAVRQFEK